VTLADEISLLEATHPRLRVESDWRLGAAIPPRFERLAQHVMAEALRNARKHADPRRVTATVKTDAGATVLEVVNDGDRDPANAGGTGMGLRLAAQDAANSGAELLWGPLSDGRWIVRLRMPAEES